MDKVKAILDGENEVLVDGLFYLYNSKYYLIYTEKKIDENGYVVLHLSQVGKEIKKSDNGTVDTGYMVGVEIQDIEDWKNVQKSITTIVEDKKSGKTSPDIKYLPINMIKKIKILGSKKFRLVKDVLEQFFGVVFDNEPIVSSNPNLETKVEEPKEVSNNPENISDAETVQENNISNEENINPQINIFNPVEDTSTSNNNEAKPDIFTSTPVETPSIVSMDNNPAIVTENSNKEENNNSSDNSVLMFRPTATMEENTQVENSNIDNENVSKEGNNTLEEKPASLFSEKEEDESIDYKSLYDELKQNNENLKQRIQELELKIENIKKIVV